MASKAIFFSLSRQVLFLIPGLLILPIFLETASYGHFGRDPFTKVVTLYKNGKEIKKEVDFFAWEKLDYVDKIKKSFKI